MNNSPLPERIRPKSLADYIGQSHLVDKGKIIPSLIATAKNNGFFPSLLLWGPPGVGKTTLARIIASELDRPFFEFSAVSASTKEIQKVVNEYAPKSGQQTIHGKPVVFLDEIHRFNKAQQDKLLPHVERGDILLIGATTENPSFEVIGPLLSRCRVLTLNQLSIEELENVANRGARLEKVRIGKKAKEFLVESSNGDARTLLNVLEIASQISDKSSISLENIEQAMQRRQYTFDKQGEEHYNVISAFIKSMRASNPDAALYFLARMVEAGQDPLYIARRMVVFASEDVGMAQPTALVVANEVFRACETIGYPECAINLAHGVVYLATAKKNRSAYDGLQMALEDVRRFGNLPVPMNLRNAPTKLMKDIGYGKGYEMYSQEDLLPDKLKGKKYYNNSKNER